MKIVEVWRDLMIKKYGSVAANSQALVMLVDSLTQWAGLQSVHRCAMAGIVLHGTSAFEQGIPECWLLKKEFDKCRAERCARVILHWFPQLLVEQMTANIASFLLGNYEP